MVGSVDLTQIWVALISTTLGVSLPVILPIVIKLRLPRLWRNPAIRGVVGGVLGAVVGLGIVYPVYNQLTCTPEVKITDPVPQTRVSLTYTVVGEFNCLPRGHSLWLIVQPTDISVYYPQPNLSLSSQGHKWSVSVGIGLDKPEDVGRSFTLLAVVVDEAANHEFLTYIERSQAAQSFPGLSLPSGATVYDKVEVIRD